MYQNHLLHQHNYWQHQQPKFVNRTAADFELMVIQTFMVIIIVAKLYWNCSPAEQSKLYKKIKEALISVAPGVGYVCMTNMTPALANVDFLAP